jgi:hypothetical protein
MIIWGSHGSEDIIGHLGCYAMVDANVVEEHIHAISSPDNVGSMFLWNLCIYLQVHKVLQLRRPAWRLWEIRIKKDELYSKAVAIMDIHVKDLCTGRTLCYADTYICIRKHNLINIIH